MKHKKKHRKQQSSAHVMMNNTIEQQNTNDNSLFTAFENELLIDEQKESKIDQIDTNKVFKPSIAKPIYGSPVISTSLVFTLVSITKPVQQHTNFMCKFYVFFMQVHWDFNFKKIFSRFIFRWDVFVFPMTKYSLIQNLIFKMCFV